MGVLIETSATTSLVRPARQSYIEFQFALSWRCRVSSMESAEKSMVEDAPDEGGGADDVLVRPPQQDRSRRTLERIVRAALELIAERGVDGASVQDIARRAKASVGSFYARFPAKEDLLRYLEIQLWTDAGAEWTEALGSRDWDALEFEDLVATLVRVLVQVNRTGSRQRRLLDARRGPGSTSEAARDFEQGLSRDVGALILRHADRIDHPDPPRAVEVCIALVMGTLRVRDSGHPALDTLESLDDEGWADELTRAALAYLRGAKGEGPRGQMDFFEIWG